MDLAAWLSSLGLGQYSSVFHENDIDFEVLAAIDDADLERLGLSLGHRRKLLKAIAERRSANSDTQQAERRQVTVMFCDLVGSTQLAARLDPEDMGDIIRRFQNAAAGAIARYNGFVARFMGDGVLAYFGFPQANEDAAEHAVRAGLGLIADIARIPRSDGSVLQARVGIATGTVMIGDSQVDVQTARNAGAWCIGCTFGLAPGSLEAIPPDVLVDSPADWTAALSPAKINL